MVADFRRGHCFKQFRSSRLEQLHLHVLCADYLYVDRVRGACQKVEGVEIVRERGRGGGREREERGRGDFWGSFG